MSNLEHTSINLFSDRDGTEESIEYLRREVQAGQSAALSLGVRAMIHETGIV